MHKEDYGDVVVNILDYYRERTKSDDHDVPPPYLEIKKKLTKVMKEGKKVLIDIKDSYSVQTVVVKLEYVHDRWVLGKSTCYHDGMEVEVPYTVHYSDIYSKQSKIKFIVEGDNPFDTEK